MIVLVTPDARYVNHHHKDILTQAKDIAGVVDLSLVAHPYVREEGEIIVGLGVKGYDINGLSIKQLTSHPAAITHMVSVLKAATILSTVRQEEKRLKVVTVNRVDELPTYDKRFPVAVDIETGGDLNNSVRWSNRIISVGLYSKSIPGVAFVVSEELAESQDIVDYLIDLKVDGVELVGHNISFDAGYISHRVGTPIYFQHDTMLMQYALNPSYKEFGLKPLAQKILGASDWEADILTYTKRKQGYDNIPREKLEEYNAYDVYWTAHLYEYFSLLLDTNIPARDIYRRLIRISHMLQDVEAAGILVDRPYMLKFRADLEEDIEEMGLNLCKIANEDFNSNSPAQVKKIIERITGEPIASTGEEALLELIDTTKHVQAELFARSLLEYRKAFKLLTSYANTFIERTSIQGRIHSRYSPHGAVTGRLSAKDPAVQTMPRDAPLKKGLIAAPGYKIVAADYSQAELRVIAELCGDKNMLAAFADGAPDFFDALMVQIYPDKFASIKDYKKFKEEHPKDATNLRALIKSVVYGTNYGRGIRAIATSLKVPEDLATAVLDRYYATYPGLKEWQTTIRRSVGDQKELYRLTTPFNRRYQAEVITYRNRNSVENAALAFLPQSIANDICLDAALEINQRIGTYGGKLILLVHDAIYCEVPEENALQAGQMIKQEMEGSGAKVFKRLKFAAEPSIGDNLDEV